MSRGAGQAGYLSEIFRSIEGEGIYAGREAVFVRTSGCRLRCSYCDTEYSRGRTGECIVRTEPARRMANPVPVAAACREVSALAGGPGCEVCITGGEPLEQPGFVAALAAGLKAQGRNISLETNGIEVDALPEVLPHVDVVAMDVKPPSAVGLDLWEKHKRFLLAASAACVFVKLVVGRETGEDELERAAMLVASIDRTIPLVLQPDGRLLFGGGRGARWGQELVEKLLRFQRGALRRLEDVRILPQFHKLLGMR